MSTNTTYKPVTLLSKYIDRFYVYQKSSTSIFTLPEILPGTGLELIFHLGEPLSANNKKLPKAHTVCPRIISHFDKEKNVSFIAVRFKSGAFRHFTSIPFSNLNNDYCSLTELWKEKGDNLLHSIENIPEIELKIHKIELFLMEIFQEYHDPRNDKWDLIINELYYHFDTNTIGKLAEKAHSSLRQFERNFKMQFGITAKEFQKITRFQNVIKHVLLDRKRNYLDTILDNGYFDQSHFIKEFKSLTKKTPLAYFTEENFDDHFYHKSIHEKDNTNL